MSIAEYEQNEQQLELVNEKLSACLKGLDKYVANAEDVRIAESLSKVKLNLLICRQALKETD